MYACGLPACTAPLSSALPRRPAVDRSTMPLDMPHTRPTQRANSCPKVANPFCRLPLPTFFHQLEAAHLGDLLRLWVRRAAKAMPAQIFKGCSARAKRNANGRALPTIAAVSPHKAIPRRAMDHEFANTWPTSGCQGKETSLLGAHSNVSGPVGVTA